MSDSLAERIIARNAALKDDAANFRTAWQDCADYIMPRRGQIMFERSPGEAQTTQLFDTTAGESNLIFAAGLLSQLIPPGEIWMRLEPAAEEASDELKEWYDRETQETLEDIHVSNFYLAAHEAFLNLGAFCTADVYLEEGKRSFLNFCSLPVGSFAIAEDSEGVVDTVFKEWKWSARQAEQFFGRQNLGPEVMKALTDKDPKAADRKFTFVHAVYPRNPQEVVEGKRVEGALRSMASVFVCVEDKHLIREDGYYEQPHAVCRLMASNGESYGRGPGMDLMPEIKLVNRMEYDLLLALEKVVSPPWLVPEDASHRPDNRPNGLTYWDSTNPANKPEQLESKAKIDMGEMKTEQKRERIRRGFFVDMFQMLNRPDVLKHERTAFQIAEMLQEKLLLFAPFFSRITHELLAPTVQRTFAMRVREGRTQPLPADIGDGAYKIVFTSKIALAIKAAQDNAVVEMLQLCSLMAPFDQSVPLVLKWRDAYRQSARNRGVPASLLRSDEEIDQMVAAMQQAEAAMKQAELAEKASKAAQNLGPEAQQIATNAVAQFKE